jgi:hypothetical protein
MPALAPATAGIFYRLNPKHLTPFDQKMIVFQI